MTAQLLTTSIMASIAPMQQQMTQPMNIPTAARALFQASLNLAKKSRNLSSLPKVMTKLANVIVPKWYLTMNLKGVVMVSYYCLSQNHMAKEVEVRKTLVQQKQKLKNTSMNTQNIIETINPPQDSLLWEQLVQKEQNPATHKNSTTAQYSKAMNIRSKVDGFYTMKFPTVFIRIAAFVRLSQNPKTIPMQTKHTVMKQPPTPDWNLTKSQIPTVPMTSTTVNDMAMIIFSGMHLRRMSTMMAIRTDPPMQAPTIMPRRWNCS